MWTAPTYQTAHQLADNALTRCGCGRRVNADMLLDVRELPASARASLAEVNASDFVCDGCLARAERVAAITRGEVLAGLGAPPEVLMKFYGPLGGA